MKAYLLRVGIDLGYGAIGPIFKDNTFEYIPIPEQCPSQESRTYVTMSGRHCDIFADYLPPKLHQCPPILTQNFF